MKLYSLLLFLILLCDISTLSISELKSIVGDDGCIEGVLENMPQGLTLITSTTIAKYKRHEFTLPLLAKRHEPTSSLPTVKEDNSIALINELATYNEIDYSYLLTDEQGPAHKKLFSVTLKLGEEEYEAVGESIKKAKQLAAVTALQNTEYSHPTRKVNKGVAMLTPTAELNNLAMKRGETVRYVLDDGTFLTQNSFYPHHDYSSKQKNYNYNFNKTIPMRNYSVYEKETTRHRPGEPFFVRLYVGDREYHGTGYTIKAARHDAAAKAVEHIRQIEIEESQQCVANAGSVSDFCNEVTVLKSPISVVHEVALKKKLDLIFEVLSEVGPPHKRVFVTQCRLGEFITAGEGTSKKESKKKAAENMLAELYKFGLVSKPSDLISSKQKRIKNKNKSSNLVKVNSAKEGINPISKLIEIQQANKGEMPVYQVLKDRSTHHEFVIEASLNGHTSIGTGSNKKTAKRNAAEGLMVNLGYNHESSSQDGLKSAVKNEDKIDTTSKATKDGQKPSKKTRPFDKSASPKEDLMFFAEVLGIEVQFSDFEKGNGNTYFSLASLGTRPPYVCLGEGFTNELSHKNAALEALKMFKKLDLETMIPNKEIVGERIKIDLNALKAQALQNEIGEDS